VDFTVVKNVYVVRFFWFGGEALSWGWKSRVEAGTEGVRVEDVPFPEKKKLELFFVLQLYILVDWYIPTLFIPLQPMLHQRHCVLQCPSRLPSNIFFRFAIILNRFQ